MRAAVRAGVMDEPGAPFGWLAHALALRGLTFR